MSSDAVNHPAHYGGDTPYEAIKVIQAWDLSFELGSLLKYVARADHKGAELEDLNKAAWYLHAEIVKRGGTPEFVPRATFEPAPIPAPPTHCQCGFECCIDLPPHTHAVPSGHASYNSVHSS